MVKKKDQKKRKMKGKEGIGRVKEKKKETQRKKGKERWIGG